MSTRMQKKSLGLALVVTLMVLAAPEADAQGFLGFSFGKHGSHGFLDFALGFTSFPPPPPPVHVHVPACRRFVAGHYEIREERVYRPPRRRRVRIPPVYRTIRDAYGRRRRILVRPGRVRVIREPGRWIVRERRVWVPGYEEVVCGF